MTVIIKASPIAKAINKKIINTYVCDCGTFAGHENLKSIRWRVTKT